MSKAPSEMGPCATAGRPTAGPAVPKPVIGVIGGIGSGKSQAAEALARRGGRIVSGDLLAHEALRQPEIRARIVERWGRDVLDEQGEVSRRRLGRIVFADRGQLAELERLVHPWIEARIRAEIEQARQCPDVRYVVLDAAIMLEAGWHTVCNKLVFVEVPRALRLERLARQRGWSEKEVEQREAAQLPLTEKASRADHVLENTSSLAHLQHQADDLLQLWGLACPPPPEEGQGAGIGQTSFHGSGPSDPRQASGEADRPGD